jgi:hypothetical protein
MDSTTDTSLKTMGAHSPENGIARSADPIEALRSEFVGGLLYAHSRANANTSKLMEAASFGYALIELLHEKGIINMEELEGRKNTVVERLTKRFRAAGMGAMLQDPEQDKYQFDGGVNVAAHTLLSDFARISFTN